MGRPSVASPSLARLLGISFSLLNDVLVRGSAALSSLMSLRAYMLQDYSDGGHNFNSNAPVNGCRWTTVLG